MIKCSRCGKMNEEGSHFCAQCGSPLVMDLEPEPREKYCISCGRKIAAAARFCHYCGAKQEVAGADTDEAYDSRGRKNSRSGEADEAYDSHGRTSRRSYGEDTDSEGRTSRRSYAEERDSEGRTSRRSYGENRDSQGRTSRRSYAEDRNSQGRRSRRYEEEDYEAYDDEREERRGYGLIAAVVGLGILVIGLAAIGVLMLGRRSSGQNGNSAQTSASTKARTESVQDTVPAETKAKETTKSQSQKTETVHEPGTESLLAATLTFSSSSEDSIFRKPETKVMDFDISTAWAEGSDGEGVGESITVDLPRETTIYGIAIVPGLPINREVYRDYGRPTELKVTANGKSETIDLSDYQPDFSNPTDSVAYVNFKKPVKTSRLNIVISDVEAGLRHSDTCIAELYAFSFLSKDNRRPKFRQTITETTTAEEKTRAESTQAAAPTQRETTQEYSDDGWYYYNADYILPDSEWKEVTRSELDRLSRDELRMAINEIYARAGRMFSNKEVQDYFNSQSWYEPLYDPETFDSNPGRYLSGTEIRNIEIIREYQKEKGYK